MISLSLLLYILSRVVLLLIYSTTHICCEQCTQLTTPVKQFNSFTLTAKPSLWVRKKKFSGPFFPEDPLSEEQLVRKFGKMEEEVIGKTLIRNYRIKRYKGVPRTDGRNISNLSSSRDLARDGDIFR